MQMIRNNTICTMQQARIKLKICPASQTLGIIKATITTRPKIPAKDSGKNIISKTHTSNSLKATAHTNDNSLQSKTLIIGMT